jgi:hypothetical protein
MEIITHRLSFLSAVGSIILDVTYNIQAQSKDDYWISIDEQSNQFAAKTLGTNKYLVDAIPIRGQHNLLTIYQSSF